MVVRDWTHRTLRRRNRYCRSSSRQRIALRILQLHRHCRLTRSVRRQRSIS
ncbi:hypothetical protein D3C76_786010 [compost metagenome]